MQLLAKITLAAGLGALAVTASMPHATALAADAKSADVTPFLTIAKDAQELAKGGDFKKARDRVKELEKVWDDAEEKMREANSDGWRDTDRKLDKALDKLRDLKPDQTAVNDAMSTLVTALETFNKPK